MNAAVIQINYGDDSGYGQVTVISDAPAKEEDEDQPRRPEIGEIPEPELQIVPTTDTSVEQPLVPGVHFPMPDASQNESEELPN